MPRSRAFFADGSAALARYLEEAHYAGMALLYMPDQSRLPGARLALSRGISDPEWNHAGLVDVAGNEIPALVRTVARALAPRGLPATVAVSPSSQPPDLGLRLGALGLRVCFRHVWHLWEGVRTSVETDGIERVESPAQFAAFLEVLRSAYSDDPPGPGFAAAIAASLGARGGDFRVVHHLAIRDGRPAGAATSIFGPGVAGLYNLAVAPPFRGQGLGRLLTRHRVALAQRRRCAQIFLQTERPAVTRWQARHGFRPVHEVVGYAAPDRHGRSEGAARLP